MYVTETLGSVNNRNVGQFLNGVHGEQLRVRAAWRKACE